VCLHIKTSVRHDHPQITSWHLTSGTRSSYRECQQPPTTFSKGWKCTVFVLGHPQLMAAKCPCLTSIMGKSYIFVPEPA
jgi:hypothetical protein